MIANNNNWAFATSPTDFNNNVQVTFLDTNPANGNAVISTLNHRSKPPALPPRPSLFNNSAVNYALTNVSGAIGIGGSAA